MTNEKRLVAACLKSREANDKIEAVLDVGQLTPYSEVVLNIAAEYYSKDKKAESVDIQFVEEKIRNDIDNPKKADLYVLHARECFAIDVSAVNIADLLLAAKKKTLAGELAQTIINEGKSKAEVFAKIDQFKAICEAQGLDEEEETDGDVEILNNVPVEEINDSVLNVSGRIKLISKQFTDYIDGGAVRGDHIIVFARPESGKTAFVLSAIRSMCWQGHKGLYFGNEDAIRRVIERFQGCLSGLQRVDRLRDPVAANTVLKDNGYDNATFISIAPGSVEEIDRYCEEYEPTWVIVDQMRNLGTKAENRTNQLEQIATGLRNIAKRRDCLMISVTQAGDSANNKLVLEMGDIDGSNTGIPAQADLLVGIGVNKEFEEHGLRKIAFSKNKLSGQHVSFDLKINPFLSSLEDL